MEVVHASSPEGRVGAGRPSHLHPPPARGRAGAAAPIGTPEDGRKPFPMRIAVVAVGTRGDVEPHAALCQGLRRSGYDARLCAPEDFAPCLGIPFDPIPLSFRSLYDRADGSALMSTGANGLEFLRRLSRVAIGVM